MKNFMMEKQNMNVETSPEFNFSEALDDAMLEIPEPGEVTRAEVLDVRDEAIYVDIGTKIDAIILNKDFETLNSYEKENIKVGDTIDVWISHKRTDDGHLLVSIARAAEQEVWDRAEEQMDNGAIIETEVSGYNKGGIIVSYDSIDGFVPNSHIPSLQGVTYYDQRMEHKSDLVGSTLASKVIEVDRKNRRLILSAKDAQDEVRSERFDELNEGDIVQGRVINIVDYGAFIDVDGIVGLLHISEMEWYRVNDPNQILSPGDEILVMVIDLDKEKEHVSLSLKNLIPNPWQEISERYIVGDLVEGEITQVRDFGTFVRLPEGIDGLIHSSEIDDGESTTYRPGDRILVRIIQIDPDRERIGLSSRRVSEDERIFWSDQHQPALDTSIDASL